MKFLDLNGLTHFWSKIKDWSNSNFFSKEGGEISPKQGLQYIINGEKLDVSKIGNENETIRIFNVDENGISAKRIVMTGGSATQVLMADGSVKTLNANNGIAGLDSKGNVPLAQLGNLDTTVAEVVTDLPTTNIKKHIYIIKDASGVTQNQYEEYIYTGDTSATYDDSKWEKLGDFRATVDLAGYAKESDAATSLEITPFADNIQFVLRAINHSEIACPSLDPATSTNAGIMTAKDKVKLDGIANNANNYSLPTASSTTKGGITLGYSQSGKNYPVALDSNGKAYVNVPWTDTTYDLTLYAKKSEAINHIEITQNEEEVELDLRDINDTTVTLAYISPATESEGGIMSSRDRVKFNSIADGATADSAISTTEIDALFV